MSIFANLAGPKIHIDEVDPASLRARAHFLSKPGEAIRVVRGKKMTTDHKLFDEVAAACQFPDYFGENWNALRECLGDLEWMPAERYVLVVTSAESILAAEPDLLQHFVIATNDVAQGWARAGERPWAPEPRPFHVVLRTNGPAAALVNLLRGTDVEFDQQSWPD
jgi:hypothetical protein